ncbi:AI-2E family transporter [Candidatus Gracilibacteria bacterium]|nr:AI-2E family transporter [Candidatus Gracilibacteria bacterium]
MKSLTSPQTRQFIVYIFSTLVAVLLVWIVYLLRDLIGLFLVACFFSLLLSPFVGRLKKWKIPDVLGILITFLSLFLIVSLFLLSIIPVFVGLAEDSKIYIVNTANALEMQARADFPVIDTLPFNIGGIIRNELNIEAIRGFIVDENRAQFIMDGLVGNIDIVRNFIQQSVGQFSTVSLSFASGVTTAVTTFFLFILLTFFIILERRVFLRFFFAILPTDLGHYFRSRQRTIGNAIHAWLRGQLLLAVFMFAINFVGLFIAQLLGLPVNHIFSLALIAGAMEFVPYLGPVIAFIPAFLMVLVSPEVSIWAIGGVIGLYVLFQQLEGNIMVPLVMSRTLSLSSLYILIVTLIGAALGGILGVLLAIPLASILHIFYHDWMHYRHTIKEAE